MPRRRPACTRAMAAASWASGGSGGQAATGAAVPGPSLTAKVRGSVGIRASAESGVVLPRSSEDVFRVVGAVYSRAQPGVGPGHPTATGPRCTHGNESPR